MGCISNCSTCEYRRKPDDGYCYMFREEPEGVCAKHRLAWPAERSPARAHISVPVSVRVGDVTYDAGRFYLGPNDTLNLSIPAREWVDMTLADVRALHEAYQWPADLNDKIVRLIRAVDEKAKEKNNVR